MLSTWDRAAMLDLSDIGIDVFDPKYHERPWWWLRAHITGLLDKPTRLAALIDK